MHILLAKYILYFDVGEVVSDSLGLTCLARLALIALAVREPRRGDAYVITTSRMMANGLTIEALHSIVIQGPTIEVVSVIVGLEEFFVDSCVEEVPLKPHQEILVQIDQLLLRKLIVLVIDQ